MGSFNPCPMAIHLLKSIRTLSASCSKKCLHLLFWMQGQRASRCSGAQSLAGTPLTIVLGKLDLDERFLCLLDRRPARTHSSLWAGDCFGFPIDVKVRQIVASFRLI